MKPSLASDHVEISTVECQNAPTESLGAGDDICIRRAQRQIAVTLCKLADPREIFISALEAKRSVFHIGKKCIERFPSQSILDQERHLGERSGGQ